MAEDLLWRQLNYCRKHINIPDLHSFVVNIKDGIAFVEVRYPSEVYIETKTQSDAETNEKTTQWCGTMVAALNRLEKFEADPETISM